MINRMCFSMRTLILLSAIRTTLSIPSWPEQEPLVGIQDQKAIGHNDLFFPNPEHPIPYKIPFTWDEGKHYHEKHSNGSENGHYRRSSCPAMNTLANRGYINRTGRNISYDEIAQAARVVWNFGDENVSYLAMG